MEKDAKLLANRIALLKQEEMKTWKKIEETRKRAKDVIGMKKSNDVRMKKKHQYASHNNKIVEQNQKKVRHLREQRRREKNKIENAILFSKKEEVKMSKL